MNAQFFRLVVLASLLWGAAMAAPANKEPKPPSDNQSSFRDSWGISPIRLTKPQDFAGTPSTSDKKTHGTKQGTTGVISAMAVNPDPNSTGIVYSSFADDPDVEVAVRNLAGNLGNDPIRIYEWVRNNIRTEFYFGAHRGAYMTMLERAGNDIDQCALLGALFKAAGYTGTKNPIYRLERVSLPRTATGANQVGAYEWLGVDDDTGALSILSDYLPSVTPEGLINFEQMWVAINIDGRGETKFAPAIKRYTVGRQPDLDALSAYTWNDVAVASGSGSTSSFSLKIDRDAVRSYFTGRSVAASDAIRQSSTLHDLSGAELARLPIILPEVVTITAPTATNYPASVSFPDNSQTLALNGIPENYCGRLRIKIGPSAEYWFEATSLLGRPLAIEFDGSGAATVRINGAQVGAAETSGNSTARVSIELTFFPAMAYFGGNPPPYQRQESILRQNSMAVIYSSGRSVGRLNKLLQDIAVKEADSAANVTLIDRLQIIGHQYASQANELTALGTSYLKHDTRWHYLAGLVYLESGRPTTSMGIAILGLHPRSGSAPATDKVFRAASLLLGALEGTAVEQHSGNKSFGTASLFDQAMTLNYGAYYLTSVGDLNSASVANFTDTYLGSGGPAAIQAYLNGGGHAVLLNNSNVTANGLSFGGWFKVNPITGAVGSYIGTAKGSGTTGTTGTQPVAPQQKPNETEVPPAHEQPKSTDPVDLTTGAFLKDDIDLVVGNEGDPNGLHLERNYNSGRRSADPAGLGRGWTHNYAMRLVLRNPNDVDALRAGYDEVLPVLLAMRHAQDTLDYQPTAARSWLLASTALTWAVNEQLGSRASITLGARSMEFVRRPNGTYTPPSQVTADLSLVVDGHNLSFRHGNTIHFRASDGRFDSIKDSFTNTLTAAYTGSNLYTVTDAYSRTLTFIYSGSRLSGVSDSTGRSVSYGLVGNNFTFTDAEGKTQTLEMNSDHLLTKVVDARARTVVENDYDAWHRVYQQRTFGDAARTTQIAIAPGFGEEIDPKGGSVRTYFDAKGRKIFLVDQLKNLTQWQYDGIDRIIKIITAKNERHDFGYDSSHVLVSETDEGGPDGIRHTRTIEPDGEHRPWKVRNFEGQETVMEYWNTSTSLVKKITAPGNIVSETTYDTRGRVETMHPASYALGEVDTYAYDGNGNLDSITHPVGASPGDPRVDDYAYSARGDLLEFIDRRLVKTSYEYNSRRQTRKVIQWEGVFQRVTETVYDGAGEVDYVLDPLGRKTDSEHDALGNLTELKRGPIGSQVKVLTNSYSDSRTLLTTVTDALNNATVYTYDAAQQRTEVKDPLNRTTIFGYDANRRATTVRTPLGFVTTNAWDPRGFKDGIENAELQLTDYSYDKDGRVTGISNRLNKSFGWSYNDAARMVTATTPTGKITTTVSNTRGLPDTTTEPSLQQTTFDAYDAEGRLTGKTDGVGTTTISYWPNGLLKEVTEGGHTTTRTYDSLNRLSQYQDGEGNTIGYTYYPSGELATIVYPGGKTVTYGYDDFGRLHSVTDWATPARTTIYTYDDASRLTKIERPNGTYRVQEYDEASQLRFIKEYRSNGSFISFQELRYDNDGRITYNFIHPKPSTITLSPDDLVYDDDNRLSTWNNQQVTFDDDGNMTNGPLPSGSFGVYGYDSRNRVTAAAGLGYRYNPDGLRVEITGTAAATFVVDPNATLSRTLLRTKGGATTYYVYGLGLLYEETGGAIRTYHFDQVGSILALTDGNQTVTDQWSYAPYGAVVSHTLGISDTPFQFNGELGVQTDPNGLSYMRARYYNPRLMRFINADPIAFEGGLNWYAFGSNNPVRLSDPLGLKDAANPRQPDGWGMFRTPFDDFAEAEDGSIEQMQAYADMLRFTFDLGFYAWYETQLGGGNSSRSGSSRGYFSGTMKGMTAAEQRIVKELLAAGHDVERLVATGTSKMADFKINGLATEFKSLERAGPNTLKNAIESAAQQSNNILIDVRDVKISSDDAQIQVQRALGNLDKFDGTITIKTTTGTVRHP